MLQKYARALSLLTLALTSTAAHAGIWEEDPLLIRIQTLEAYQRNGIDEAYSDQLRETARYFEENPTELKRRVINGWSALQLVARKNPMMAMKLIDMGADVHAKDSLGETPIFNAIRGGHLELVRYMVEEKSARLDVVGIENQTTIHAAAEIMVRQLWDENDAGRLMEYVLSHTPFKLINAQTTDCESALHLAINSGNVQALRLLIDHKADLDLKNAQNMAPLRYSNFRNTEASFKNKDPEVTKVLEAATAKLPGYLPRVWREFKDNTIERRSCSRNRRNLTDSERKRLGKVEEASSTNMPVSAPEGDQRCPRGSGWNGMHCSIYAS